MNTILMISLMFFSHLSLSGGNNGQNVNNVNTEYGYGKWADTLSRSAFMYREMNKGVSSCCSVSYSNHPDGLIYLEMALCKLEIEWVRIQRNGQLLVDAGSDADNIICFSHPRVEWSILEVQ